MIPRGSHGSEDDIQSARNEFMAGASGYQGTIAKIIEYITDCQMDTVFGGNPEPFEIMGNRSGASVIFAAWFDRNESEHRLVAIRNPDPLTLQHHISKKVVSEFDFIVPDKSLRQFVRREFIAARDKDGLEEWFEALKRKLVAD